MTLDPGSIGDIRQQGQILLGLEQLRRNELPNGHHDVEIAGLKVGAGSSSAPAVAPAV